MQKSGDTGSAVAGLLAFVLSMAIILGGVYVFFMDYKARYLDPLQALRTPKDSLEVLRLDSLFVDSLKTLVQLDLEQTLNSRSDSLVAVEKARTQNVDQVTEKLTRERELRLSIQDIRLLSRVLSRLKTERAVIQLERLGPDNAARILTEMPSVHRGACLQQMNESLRATIRRKLRRLAKKSRRS